jgi:hypothetical protein
MFQECTLSETSVSKFQHSLRLGDGIIQHASGCNFREYTYVRHFSSALQRATEGYLPLKAVIINLAKILAFPIRNSSTI